MTRLQLDTNIFWYYSNSFRDAAYPDIYLLQFCTWYKSGLSALTELSKCPSSYNILRVSFYILFTSLHIPRHILWQRALPQHPEKTWVMSHWLSERGKNLLQATGSSTIYWQEVMGQRFLPNWLSTLSAWIAGFSFVLQCSNITVKVRKWIR